VRIWEIHYTAHNGTDRLASIVLPSWYGPNRNPRIPVVISPHGRNGTGLSNVKYFGNLPAVGRFAVISPDGMGRRLAAKSYAYRGQIEDLARMPEIAERALPWLRLDRNQVYALGSSMGGHETLMLIARYPKLLAGAAAMDSVTDLSLRYSQLPDTACSAEPATEGVRRPEPGRIRSHDRRLRCPAPDLVERRRQDRHRPEASVGNAVPAPPRAECKGARQRIRRPVEALEGDAIDAAPPDRTQGTRSSPEIHQDAPRIGSLPAGALASGLEAKHTPSTTGRPRGQARAPRRHRPAATRSPRTRSRST
jgi:pimeloyl-ACP methyl ester carboxylesterase